MKAINIPSRQLALMIKAHNGVREVKATLKGNQPADSRFSKSLASVMKDMRNARSVTTSWTADENQLLEEQDVSLLWDELDTAAGLSSVTLKFGDGTSQNDIENYQEKRPVDVQSVRPGIPVATEIANELRSYMSDLMNPTNGTRIITAEGMIVPIQS
jgi:hypothetical protein